VFVLVVWFGCTVNCAIADLAGGGSTACCKDDGRGRSDQSPSDSGKCVCGFIKSGGYLSQEGAVLIPQPLEVLCLLDTSLQYEALVRRPGLVEISLSPPDILRAWQFFLRAALPVRAPSLAS
jgi:hypothetical protein